jgi:galactose mutarotase-like enzyme
MTKSRLRRDRGHPGAAGSVMSVPGEDHVVTLRVGDTALEVRPEFGLVCSSLTVAGREFLRFHSVEAVLGGHTSGIPLLAPWANRLRGPGYIFDGVEVGVLGAAGVHVDNAGLPIHGTMVGRNGWVVDTPVTTSTSARLSARFDASGCSEVMASFPFPHALGVEYVLEPGRLTVTTTLTATGSLAVPVSFGWHPYFVLPDSNRDDWFLELPDRHHLELDNLHLPTGREKFEPAESVSLTDAAFDDGYRLGDDRSMALTDGMDRIDVEFDAGYSFAQVYAPIASDLVALEPMTAATDALSHGSTTVVEPGESMQATFTISITREEH